MEYDEEAAKAYEQREDEDTERYHRKRREDIRRGSDWSIAFTEKYFVKMFVFVLLLIAGAKLLLGTLF